MRVPRRVSCSGYYHVVVKGDGRQAIFEDDADRRTFLRLAERCFAEAGISVIAWCLMENHVHLVLRDDADGLSAAMHRLETAYARHYNDRSGRVGHLFRERFMSSPIESDAYLLEAVRYVHNNPEKAGVCRAEEYPWSSYRAYAAPGSACGLTVDTSVVLEMLGGEKNFVEFAAERGPRAYRPPSGKRLDESEARDVAEQVLGGHRPRRGEGPACRAPQPASERPACGRAISPSGGAPDGGREEHRRPGLSGRASRSRSQNKTSNETE